MCRNIKILHHFEPPTTEDEMRAAALQYVRKVSGLNAPAAGSTDHAAFDRATAEIAASTERLLKSLLPRGAARTREREREKARERWKKREAAIGVRVTPPTRDE